MSTGARPAPVRTLLRVSKRFGSDAARHREDGSGAQRTERALSRGLARVGHWGDARNPEGARRMGGAWWLLLGGVAVAVLAAVTLSARRRQGPA